MTEFAVFARFHARPGQAAAVAAAIAGVVPPTRAEPGCLAIRAFRLVRGEDGFVIHSRWRDEAAFDVHAALPHTVAFLCEVEPLLRTPPEILRTLDLKV